MKKLISFLAICFLAFSANAIPDIVAVVNKHPITAYDLKQRMKMLQVINNIDEMSPVVEQQITAAALRSLIDEEILFEHSKKIKINVSDPEIDEAIRTVDDRNKTPRGYLIEFFKNQNIDINSFKNQIKSDLIKMKIASQISRGVSISPKEIDMLVLPDNTRDISVEAIVVRSNNKSKDSFAKMDALRKKVTTCSALQDNMYNKFAHKEVYKQNLNRFDSQLQAIIQDLEINKASKVMESPEGFKLLLVCKRDIKFSHDKENELIVNFLTNRKVSQKAKQFFSRLHKMASIKIFL